MSASKIQCTELELVCPTTGKVLLVLKPLDDGGGLWITGPEGNEVAIYSIRGQTGIGIDSPRSKLDTVGMPICLSVDSSGDGYIQIRKGDQIKEIGFDDL